MIINHTKHQKPSQETSWTNHQTTDSPINQSLTIGLMEKPWSTIGLIIDQAFNQSLNHWFNEKKTWQIIGSRPFTMGFHHLLPWPTVHGHPWRFQDFLGSRDASLLRLVGELLNQQGLRLEALLVPIGWSMGLVVIFCMFEMWLVMVTWCLMVNAR